MKRLVNIRIPVLIASILALGIFTGYLFIFKSIDLFWIIASIPVTAIIFIILLVTKRKVAAHSVLFVCAAMLIVGFLSCYFRLSAFDKSELSENTTYTFTATVYEKNTTKQGEYLIIKNVKADGVSIDGKMMVYLGEKYGEYCDAGYKITFNAKVYKNDLFTYGKLNYYTQSNVRYVCNVYYGMKSERGFSLFGSIRSRICTILQDNLSAETAAVAQALITGNTQNMESDVLDSFRYGGIAHIFAVSGLHIGLVYGFFYFLGKKLKLNKYVFTCFCLLPVFFYVGVCGFTLSSLRAAIMCTVTRLAGLLHEKYDGLNSLSVSTALILLINPVNLFAVGFQLSVCAVAGITLLSKRIARPFGKIPKYISTPVSVSLSAQAGTLPVMFLNFGYISGVGLLMNILFVPIMSVIFIILFVSVLICLILPFAAPIILPYAALPLEAIIYAFVDAGFEKALITGFGAAIFVPLYFLALFIISDKINLKLTHRIFAFVGTLAVGISYAAYKIYEPIDGYRITVSAYYGSGEVLIKSDSGKVLIIYENSNVSRAKKFLNDNFAANLSTVIILGDEACASYYGKLSLGCKNVVVYGGYGNYQPYRDLTVRYETDFYAGGISFDFYDGYTLSADCGGAKICIGAFDKRAAEDCDLLITDNADAQCADYITVGLSEQSILYNVYDFGEMTFHAKNGVLKR